ncbi:MAG: glycogen debranching enzyme GlgX, partial [Acidobacteriota bacterium]
PWDCGPGGYQVGGFPPGWSEWNDKYRDTTRNFWRAAEPAGPLAPRLCASADVFKHNGRRPWASINFITAHDGFTLHDLVSYTDKHNDANREGNTDGTLNNNSWNCGVEGPTDDPEVNALRGRQMRNLLMTLLFSQGVPMLVAGDEMGRTQQGNNNAYCQDNEVSWVDWERAREWQPLTSFVQRLIALRQSTPVFRVSHFLTAELHASSGFKEVTWINTEGTEIRDEQWTDPHMHCFGMLIDLPASNDERTLRDGATVILVFNSHHDVVNFTMPTPPDGTHWELTVDTNTPDVTAPRPFPSPARMMMTARSCVLFTLAAGQAELGPVLDVPEPAAVPTPVGPPEATSRPSPRARRRSKHRPK